MSQSSSSASGSDDKVREVMRRYWGVYKPSLESMMLSNDAKYLAENEQNELISYLPPYKGIRVLELGAGIGRFTSRLALVASHVTAIDFMESYIEENKIQNGHLGNIEFHCADVTKLDFPKGSFDLVFSNWLLMYLTNTEVENLMRKVLEWTAPEGHFFFRESCYHQSGNVVRTENPTRYRTPLDYITMLSKASTNNTKFLLKSAKNILTYVHYHGNPNQLCLLAQKKEKSNADVNFQKSVEADEGYSAVLSEKKQFRARSVADIAAGEFMIKDVCTSLGLRAGKRVLVIGCEQGACPMLVTKHCGAFVHGVAGCPLCIHHAIEAQGRMELEHRKKIQYESTNWKDSLLSSGSYEAVFCFDFTLSRADSLSLISESENWLKENGKLVLLALVTSENNSDPDSQAYVSEAELLRHLKPHHFSLPEETVLKDDLALKHLKGVEKDLKEDLGHAHNHFQDREQALQDIANKIELLQSKKIKLLKLTATRLNNE